MPVIILSPDFTGQASGTEGHALIACSSNVVATPGGIFDPTTITGLKLWAEARLETGFSDSDPVATWTDFSGEGNHLTQATEANKPLYRTNIINGEPAMQFDGSNDYFGLSNILSGESAGEVFLVVQIDTDPPGASAQSGIWNMDGDGSNACHYPFTNGTIYDAWGSTARKTTVNPSPALTSPRLYNVSSESGAWTSRLDGAQIYTTATNTFSSFSGSPYLGRSASGFGDVYLDGYIAAILIFNAVLASGDRDYIEAQLGAIYNITIS